MARIRSIKPSFWSDDLVSELSRDARLLLVALFSMADDEGRFVASPQAIAGYAYPYDDLPVTKIRSWLREIESKARAAAQRNGGEVSVLLYEVNGRQYGVLRKYRRHQRISHPQPSPLPPPPGEEMLI